MRGVTHLGAADLVARGHARIQHLRTGCSTLTATVPRCLRVAAAWSRLVLAISLAPVLLRARCCPLVGTFVLRMPMYMQQNRFRR
jgi:hypothetical protein